jgi:hypothetical protein
VNGLAPALDRPPLEAAQPFEHILRPADRFAELAVADDVDARLGLLVHDLGDGAFQARVVGGLRRTGLPACFGAQEILQRRRPDQAADMRGENAIRAALHCPLVVARVTKHSGGAASIRRFACEPYWATSHLA